MAEIKIAADSGGGSVGLVGPASTTSNAALQFKLPVADGSSGQYLKTDGSGNLSWATASGGGGGGGKLTLISSTTFTSATSAVTFTSISGYTQYKIFFHASMSGAGHLALRVGIDGTYDTGSNYRLGGASPPDKLVLVGAFSSTSQSGEMLITHLNQALSTKIQTFGIQESTDGSSMTINSSKAGGHGTTTAQNCIQIYGTSGDIPSGTFTLYGIATS